MSERLVNGAQAAEMLGVGETFVSALKRAAGVSGRKFFISALKKYLRDNPGFTIGKIYQRAGQRKGNRLSPATVVAGKRGER